jgi:type IV pilus assembly protein PilC
MMLFVIPQIGKILLDLGGPDAKLPAITQAMLGISSFMINYWYICIGGVVGFIFLAKWYLATPQGKSQYHHLILKMPGVGPIIKKIAVARFARTYASLIGAGVSLVEALRVTGEAIGNEVYKEVLTKAVEEVKGGKQLSGALAQANVFPAIVPQMLAVGEETGQTDTILVKVADFYEEEVDASIEGISSIIEPVMIVVMGGLVGLIAVSVMGPIASLSQNVQ